MSDCMPFGFSDGDAKHYNEKYAKQVGWYGEIPEAAFVDYPCLAHDAVSGTEAEKTRFALEVYAFQQNVFADEVQRDGKLGQFTWIHLLKTYDVVDDVSYIVSSGRRFATPNAAVCSFEDQFGYDLHHAGNFSKRKKKPSLIVIHWGGATVRGLYSYFNNPTRDLSTHFGIGVTGSFQFLDLKHRAWHAGYVNDFSIGIDICQQPTRNYLDYYLKRGYSVEEAINQTDRGRKEIISLEESSARHLRELVFELCRITGIPARAPRGHVGMDMEGPVFHGLFYPDILKNGDFQGVVGHHHLSDTKWDMACWWGQVFDGTELGD